MSEKCLFCQNEALPNSNRCRIHQRQPTPTTVRRGGTGGGASGGGSGGNSGGAGSSGDRS